MTTIMLSESQRLRQRSLTPEQVHEIRMSPTAHYLIADELGVGQHVISTLRTGRTYGPLTGAEKRAQSLRAAGPDPYRLADHGLWFGASSRAGIRTPDLAEVMDAAHECPSCGAMPHDPNPCDCEETS
jgi:hypothetical protein